MCGILGFITKEGRDDSFLNKFKAALKRLAHRGPDYQDIFVTDNIVFGHTRLAILDLTKESNQPFVSRDGKIVLVFNGEIYNHQDLRKKINYSFRTKNSDTETLLACYLNWGIEKTLLEINGMFAFALYDSNRKITHIARDRLGKKPLYYTDTKEGLAFSSEISALLTFDFIDKKIDDESIYHYLTLLTTPSPRTFFKNIAKLDAGHRLVVKGGEVKKYCYWDIAKYINQVSNISEYESLKIFEDKLAHSMCLRNVSDVPISIALSGGIDSSLNLVFSNRLSSLDLSAITISAKINNDYNEAECAKKLCEDLGVSHQNIKVDDATFISELNEYLSIHQDTPCGDPNYVLMYIIAKQIRDMGRKVILVGEGGDELGGYPVYKQLQRESNILNKIPKFMYPYLSYIPLSKPFDFFVNNELISRRHVHCFTEVEKRKFWKDTSCYNSYSIIKSYMDEIQIETKDSFLRKILNVEYKLRLPELILARIDYPTMAASIEARSPFMDHRLIEYTAQLPFDLKMKHYPKFLLKKVAEKHLPNYMLNRKKIGFGMLLSSILNENVPEWLEKDISNSDVPLFDYIDKRFLLNLLSQHKKSFSHGYKIWILYALNRWLIKHA